MKQSWQIYKLEDICTIYDKLRKPISKKDRVSGIYPYYGASSVQDYVNDYLFDGRYVLIGEDGAKWESGEDTAYIVEGKFWVNNHAHIIQCNNGIVDTFIYYYFNHLDLTKLVAGAIIPKLTQETLRSMEIPIPSFSEQQRIVALLDAEFAKIDALKANAEKNLQNAKDLFQAALKKELEPKEGWKTKSLSQVVDSGTHISYGIVQPEEDIPNGVPIVRPMDLTTEILTSTTNLKRTKQSISEAYQRSILKGSEILMCVRGTTGIVSLSSIELKGCNTTRGIVPLCISDDKTRKFVYYVLRSEACQKYISEYTNGTALKQINIADVKNIPIVVAPYDEQATIIYRLDALNDKCKSLQANYEKTLSLCDDLKQALLRKAFNGEI